MSDSTVAKQPQYVYAESREEAQRFLDESYLTKFRAVPPGLETYVYIIGIATGICLGVLIGWLLWNQ